MTDDDGEPMEATTLTDQELRELSHIASRAALARMPISARAHVADDIAQEALIDYVAYAANHVIENPEALMRIIARRRAQKYQDGWKAVNRQQKSVALGDEPEHDKGHHVADERDYVAAPTAIDRFEDLAEFEWAIAQLPDNLRAVAELSYLGDGGSGFLLDRLSAPEVAKRLGLAEGTVRNRLVKARALLRELLAEER